jgi:hypothetical protein
MGVWQGVATDYLKFHPGRTLVRPASGPSLKRPYNRFRGGLPAAVFHPFEPHSPYAYGERKPFKMHAFYFPRLYTAPTTMESTTASCRQCAPHGARNNTIPSYHWVPLDNCPAVVTDPEDGFEARAIRACEIAAKMIRWLP